MDDVENMTGIRDDEEEGFYQTNSAVQDNEHVRVTLKDRNKASTRR